jgi:hypothetical protein
VVDREHIDRTAGFLGYQEGTAVGAEADLLGRTGGRVEGLQVAETPKERVADDEPVKLWPVKLTEPCSSRQIQWRRGSSRRDLSEIERG